MPRVRSATPAVIRERYSIAPSIAAIQFAAYRTLAHFNMPACGKNHQHGRASAERIHGLSGTIGGLGLTLASGQQAIPVHDCTTITTNT
jgi:hypothetical protein